MSTAPGYPEGYQFAEGPLGSIIDARVTDVFQKWGFVIMRGAYDNDAQWDTFMGLFRASLLDELHDFELEAELGPDLEITVIEDRAVLENARKDAVRPRFLRWVDARSVERDGEGADAPNLVEDLPRFKYCVYVDQVCLNSLSVSPVDGTPGAPWCLKEGQIIVIDATGAESYEPSAEGGYEPVEGNASFNVGWAYFDIHGLTEMYAELCDNSGNEMWYASYTGNRPYKQPEFDPRSGRPLSEVPQGVSYGRRVRGNDEV
ncbi:uncharacterized protein B0I36DRAFT_340962 [Microdochium trichocladiopsis]|uniref:Uncharacterized protein n=1 Tax=Microdochium trichocladiopsis TaxID=1682393 RepID=A0A9P8XQ49_9PEZI|nr:uncharacterized protein B0I36DRAFT_340962 [Microdochium trichocladiopsis]KAH7010777.1 hypothetical protein B0I36DRAFT_340962 [Microdochium trichocladiopsis]